MPFLYYHSQHVHREEPDKYTKLKRIGQRDGRSTTGNSLSSKERESVKTQQAQSFPPKGRETEGREIAHSGHRKAPARGVLNAPSNTMTRTRGNDKKGDRRQRTPSPNRRRPSLKPKNRNRTGTRPSKKEMIDHRVSITTKNSAQKTQMAITGIFHSGYFTKKQSKAGTIFPCVHLSEDGCSPSLERKSERDKVKDSKAIAKQTKA